MPNCFLQRIAPFALTLLIGLAAASLLGSPFSHKRNAAGFWREGKRSRTALVIHSLPQTRDTRVQEAACDGCAVRMRVMFGVDGTVSGNEFHLSPPSYRLIDEAAAAARKINFTPATRNKRPMPVWAHLIYSCDRENQTSTPVVRCRLTIDEDSVRTGRGRPWRVIIPHE